MRCNVKCCASGTHAKMKHTHTQHRRNHIALHPSVWSNATEERNRGMTGGKGEKETDEGREDNIFTVDGNNIN